MAIAIPTRSLGRQLAKWRRHNRMKQCALARELGVAQSTLSRWEAGAAEPGDIHQQKLRRLLTAAPNSSADFAVRDLVHSSRARIHLICDLTHKLIAASKPRQRAWRTSESELVGASLWRFRTQGIETGERDLAETGWFNAQAQEAYVQTERSDFSELTIHKGWLKYTRFMLSDGRFARLVIDVEDAAPP